MSQIILASKSKRRIDLLNEIGFDFMSIPSSIDERKINKKIRPSSFCMNASKLKALDISNKNPNSLVVGSDTIIYFQKKIIGKPNNIEQAKKNLLNFSDKTHIVYSGISIIKKNEKLNIQFYDKTYVTFNKIQKEDVEYYIKNHNCLDKAGAYGIQSWSKIFIKRINGCYNNVIGFPISEFYKLCNSNVILKKHIRWKKKTK